MCPAHVEAVRKLRPPLDCRFRVCIEMLGKNNMQPDEDDTSPSTSTSVGIVCGQFTHFGNSE